MHRRISIFLFLLATACCRAPESICVSEPPAVSSVDYEWLHSNWWEAFEDPQLNGLVEQALANNPTLQTAIDRMALAGSRANIVRSYLYPTVDFETDSTKFAQSKTGIFGPPPGSTTPLLPLHYTQTEYTFNFQFEIDLWQKNWNAWKAALGEVEAKKAETMIARMILSLAVAEAYYQLQTDRVRVELARRNVADRESLFTLSQGQVKQNIQTSLVLNQRSGDIAIAKELLYALEKDVEIDKHWLSSLVAVECCQEMAVNPVPFTSWERIMAYLPEELPVDLLAHRPDIQAHLWRVKAASYQIKVAHALFLPNVNLLAMIGQQTIHLDKLFNNNSFYGTWGPAIHLPIFEGGALNANLGARRAEYRIAVDEYRQAVLTAVRQVLDALAIQFSTGKQLKEAELQRQVAQNNVALTESRVRANIDNRFNLLSAEIELLRAEDNEAILRWNQVQAILEFVRALGGGYAHG